MSDSRTPRQILADILLNVPDCHSNHITVYDLSKLCQTSYQATLISLSFLCLFDVIEILPAENSWENRVRASNECGGFLIKTLSTYLRSEEFIVSNWERL